MTGSEHKSGNNITTLSFTGEFRKMASSMQYVSQVVALGCKASIGNSSGKIPPSTLHFARTSPVEANLSRNRSNAQTAETLGKTQLQKSQEILESYGGRGIYDTLSCPLQEQDPKVRVQERKEFESWAAGRRGFVMWSILLSTISAVKARRAAAENTYFPLELYSDAKAGFTLLRPTLWNKVEKPGASIFFEDPQSRRNNIGVTVAPVRIASLYAFGSVDDVVRRLVKAERDKPSTNDMQVVRALEKKIGNNTPVYFLEYILDGRGRSRILTTITVAAYKLYILSITFADSAVAPASSELNGALHQVVDSFELLS